MLDQLSSRQRLRPQLYFVSCFYNRITFISFVIIVNLHIVYVKSNIDIHVQMYLCNCCGIMSVNTLCDTLLIFTKYMYMSSKCKPKFEGIHLLFLGLDLRSQWSWNCFRILYGFSMKFFWNLSSFFAHRKIKRHVDINLCSVPYEITNR